MGNIFSIFDYSCRFNFEDEDNDDTGLLMYYHIPSPSDKSLKRRKCIQKQIQNNLN